MKNIQILYKTLILLIFILVIIYISVDIKSEDNILNEFINVEIRGEVYNPGIYQLNRNSNYEDIFNLAILKQDADISNISLQNNLYNKQLIIINKKQENNLISINCATLEQLSSLPGIGENIARNIIDYRDNVGSFLTLQQLKEVKGIGDKKYEKIKQYICL